MVKVGFLRENVSLSNGKADTLDFAKQRFRHFVRKFSNAPVSALLSQNFPNGLFARHEFWTYFGRGKKMPLENLGVVRQQKRQGKQ